LFYACVGVVSNRVIPDNGAGGAEVKTYAVAGAVIAVVVEPVVLYDRSARTGTVYSVVVVVVDFVVDSNILAM